MSRPLPIQRALVGAVLLVVVVAFALLGARLTAADAATSPTVRACGNLDVDGLLISDITAKRTTCKNARSIARAAATRDDSATATIRGYVCLRGEVTGELTFGRCSKAEGRDELRHVVRFDFGS